MTLDTVSIVTHLKNTGIRPGESKANVAKRIASSYDSQQGMGLTKTGRQQVEALVRGCIPLTKETVIYTSDYERAYETAQCVAHHVGCELIPTRLLRDRYLGQLDGTSVDNYALVWEKDSHDPEAHAYGSERVTDVADRLIQLLQKLDTERPHTAIALVSHGEVLGVLEALLKGVPLALCKTVMPWGHAEYRCFTS